MIFAVTKLASAQQSVTLYDRNPDHLWNRIHAAIFIRATPTGTIVGNDTLDPLLWSQSTYLLEQPLHDKLRALLEEFLSQHGENLFDDPLKRAVLQHDLWTVFDWCCINADASPAKQALQRPLARIIKRLALTKAQITALPDTYAAGISSNGFPTAFDPNAPTAAFLPADLLSKNGSWLAIGTELIPGAPRHTQDAGGRSAFTVLVRLPGARAESKSYIGRLNAASTPYVRSASANLNGTPGSDIILNPNLPQFPAMTQFALVRQMMLIDSDGKVQVSPIIEQVQLRVHRDTVRFFELTMHREKLFENKAGGLQAASPDDLEFPSPELMQHGVDLIDNPQQNVLQSCAVCHVGNNLPAFLSFNRPDTPKTIRPPSLADRSDWDAMGRWTAISSKYLREDWVALKRLWIDDQK